MRGSYKGFNLDDCQKKVESLIDGIIALKIKLKAIEGRFKLSQDKSKDDVNSALKYFASSVATSFDTDLAKVLIASTRRMDDHR
jgi:predicted FMN-binding regulatory protein PaiB